MPKRWLDPVPVDVPDALRDAVGGHPLVAEMLARRGLRSVEAAEGFLFPNRYSPASPSALPDMDSAVSRLRFANRKGEPICVWGDFDVDGQTSTALLVSALRDLGANVDYHIPHRQHEGHGINLPNLKRIIEAGAKLIVTCDTGISAHEAVDYAKSRGIDVVITDHHNLPPDLPNAFAVVNPKRLPHNHPLRELPGVGVAYKLIEALNDDSPALLDLVALGIVADVALQVRDTRYLLQRGLVALRATQRLGLQAMIELAEIDPARITEEQIGFTLAPRLNALGRLEDATLAVELLTTRDLERARILAQRLEGLNAQRKLLVEQVYNAAQAQIEQDSSLLETNVLVLAHPQWHGGVVGIVATRLVEEYQRPVILLVSPPGEAAYGSARSVESVDITAALSANAKLLTTFGGHAMAAGLSLPAENISMLRRALSCAIDLPTSEPMLNIDAYVELADLSLEFVADMERLVPFGAGNPAPTLGIRKLTVRSHSTVGRSGDHTQLTVEDQAGNKQRILWWRSGEIPSGQFDLALSARSSDYRGERQMQLEWIDARPAEGMIEVRAPKLEIVDYRAESDPMARLRELGDVQVWREADARVAGKTRHELAPAESLIIWTSPPSSAELRAVLEWVRPQRIILFAADAGLDALEPFVKRLAGLVKYALSNRDGVVRLDSLAAATAQREITVRAGLDWLTARGQITITSEDSGTLTLTNGAGKAAPDLVLSSERLGAHLRETAAYRAFYRRADPARLLAE